MSTLEELEEKRAETNFATATCGLTILRCVTCVYTCQAGLRQSSATHVAAVSTGM
jgi:predicted RNA-binding Zn-ribbon protein involved in translation (DUF1610 family)